jgi:purine-binding chemotaxis protein CheW
MRVSKHSKSNHPRTSSADTVAEATPAVRGGRWVVFRLDAGRYALPLAAVTRIVRSVLVTPLPMAPSVVSGAIDVAGEIVPVFNLRRRFGLPERCIGADDQFVLAVAANRQVALVIDGASGVIDQPEAAMVDSAALAPQLAHIRGVIGLEGGLVLIQDLEQFLSADEAEALEQAIDRARVPDAH